MKMLALLMLMVDGGSGDTPEVQLLDFSASYCQPCQQMVPVLQAMERDGFPVRQIDITEEHELARRFQVDRVPTLVLLVEGKEAKRFVGLTSAAELRREMNAAARKLAESRGHQPDSNTALQEPNTDSAETDLASAENSNDAIPDGPPERRPTMGEKLRSLLSGEKKEAPTVRGQSPEMDERMELLKRAYAATVRVKVTGTRVKDGLTVQDVGTGTIVDSGNGQCIVLTCAHLFLGISTKDTKVLIEVFENGKAMSYTGSVIGGNHDSDIAFLKFQSTRTLPAVPLTKESPAMAIGEKLMSFGCDDGADPTPLETKLIEVNRYQGPENLVCEKDPAGGRSGGGLFNRKGELVAICSCADRKRKEGLYMAHKSVLKLAEKLQLTSILRASEPSMPVAKGEDAADVFGNLMTAEDESVDPKTLAATDTRTMEVSDESFDTIFGVSPTENGAKSSAENTVSSNASTPDGSRRGTSSAPQESPAAETLEPEVVIEIADRTQGGKKRRVVIPKASPWLLEMLTGEGAEHSAAVASELTRPDAERETTSARTSQLGSHRKNSSKRATTLSN